MPWVKFVDDMDYRHASRAVTAYKAGQNINVPMHIAREALARGKAVESESARKAQRLYVEDGDGE